VPCLVGDNTANLGLSLFAATLVPLGAARGIAPTPALINILAVAGAGLGLSGSGMQTAVCMWKQSGRGMRGRHPESSRRAAT